MRRALALAFAVIAWTSIRGRILFRFWRTYPAELVLVLIPPTMGAVIHFITTLADFGSYLSLIQWGNTITVCGMTLRTVYEEYLYAEHDYRYGCSRSR